MACETRFQEMQIEQAVGSPRRKHEDSPPFSENSLYLRAMSKRGDQLRQLRIRLVSRYLMLPWQWTRPGMKNVIVMNFHILDQTVIHHLAASGTSVKMDPCLF
jgi:hypothetical protein